jgi:hypothetical protein
MILSGGPASTSRRLGFRLPVMSDFPRTEARVGARVNDIAYSYRYTGSSSLRDGLLGLCTFGGSALRRHSDQPLFLAGFVTRPAVVATGLRAVAKVAATKCYRPDQPPARPSGDLRRRPVEVRVIFWLLWRVLPTRHPGRRHHERRRRGTTTAAAGERRRARPAAPGRRLAAARCGDHPTELPSSSGSIVRPDGCAASRRFR